MEEGVTWSARLAVMLGVWLIVGSLVFIFVGPMMHAPIFWSTILVGSALTMVAVTECQTGSAHAPLSVHGSLLLALFGGWLCITPLVFDPVSRLAVWTTIGSGVVLVALAGYAAYHWWTHGHVDVATDGLVR